MCGIVGWRADVPVAKQLLQALARLEYRGYDSAGVALIEQGELEVVKCKGKIAELNALLGRKSWQSQVGIAHTRWATHGKPTQANAHPHVGCQGRIALVHNGIIENYQEIKEKLIQKGHSFASETDTEVIPHLIEEELRMRGEMMQAIPAAFAQLKGAYAFALISADLPDKVFFARLGSPLVLGRGKNAMMLASDIPALLPFTQEVWLLDDGEWGFFTQDTVCFWDASGAQKDKEIVKVDLSAEAAEKGGFEHFMLKEISEQPKVVALTFAEQISGDRVNLTLQAKEKEWLSVTERFFFVACGTAYHAGLTALYFWERLLPQPLYAAIASEFRYRHFSLSSKDTLVVISQSGETADTMAAMRKARKAGAKVLAICNVVGSTLAREADAVLFTRAGVEIGVASTKAYTCQITAAYLLGIAIAKACRAIDKDKEIKFTRQLREVPNWMAQVLEKKEHVLTVAEALSSANHFLYLGRDIFYPQALEGALKLKEISYIHAEGYPAGEMKHGPIALIDKMMPVVCLAPRAPLYAKMVSNIKEVEARDGKIVGIGTEKDALFQELCSYYLSIPPMPDWAAVLVIAPYLQLLAYHIARLRGCEIDQPRNLAKSVTVE